jgi:DeoR/GlpR family transcriptional regulator of sugar metabolism
MLPEERRSKIQALLLERFTLTTAELSTLLDASAMTIRRDLDELAERGICQRVHGGAMRLRVVENSSTAYPTYRMREQTRAAEKAAIARAAAALVRPGDTIALDTGTTAAYVARTLRNVEGITVISNSLNVLQELADLPGVVCISPGGMVVVEDVRMGGGELTFAGPVAVAGLRSFRPRLSFIGSSGFTLTHGTSDLRPYQVEIKRTLLEIAEAAVLMTDSTKFGRANGMLVAPATAFRTIITDAGVGAADVAALRRLGIEVTVVDPEREPITAAPSSGDNDQRVGASQRNGGHG